MNEACKIFCDGASMAYKDVSKHLIELIDNAPSEVRDFMEALRPFALATESKAKFIYEEMERLEKDARH